jgi:hypothetical protein
VFEFAKIPYQVKSPRIVSYLWKTGYFAASEHVAVIAHEVVGWIFANGSDSEFLDESGCESRENKLLVDQPETSILDALLLHYGV